MKRWKKAVIAIAAVLILIQFFQPDRNQHGQAGPTDIHYVFAVPANVSAILHNSCYDCHSNQTRYPWYSQIQPGASFMASHINDGKDNLNLSEFGTYSKRKQENKLKSIANEIKDEAMPLSSYTMIHQDARLTPTDKRILINWVNTVRDSLLAIQ